MSKRWVLPKAVPPEVAEALAHFPPCMRSVLFQRGVRSRDGAEAFLSASDPERGDPFQLRGMALAVERTRRAIRDGEAIAVYGDYDADGVSGTALLVETLDLLGAQARPYIPHRFDEGYGLHNEALSALHEEGARLVISVDCGVRSLREAEYARSLGLDLIITDHHQPGTTLPDAFAVVNPKQSGDEYGFKGLAGVGIAYKLAQALLSEISGAHLEEMLDLVAIGTVADLAPLEGENRALVRAGLRRLNAGGTRGAAGRPGIVALAEASGIPPGRITASSVAFALAPRLNAAGRLDSADTAYRLLMSREVGEAQALASELNTANRQRQAKTRETVENARKLAVVSDQIPDLLAASAPEFSIGVAGLAAARLMEEYYRPAVVAQWGEETTRGSARSIPEFHILAALDSCADILLEFGGHAAAAGFTVRTADLEVLLGRLSELAGQALRGKDVMPRQPVDAIVELRELNLPLLGLLDAIEPCGYGNPTPVLAATDVGVLQSRAVGAEGSHLKLTLRQGPRTLDAIAFRRGALAGSLPRRVDVAFTLERNVYLGVESLQLNIQDIRPASEGEWAEE